MRTLKIFSIGLVVVVLLLLLVLSGMIDAQTNHEEEEEDLLPHAHHRDDGPGIVDPALTLHSVAMAAGPEQAPGSDDVIRKPKKASSSYKWDENGYLMFCLCMGRFGNQAEHLLGSMAFAKALNRTLVVPPFISYPAHFRGITLTPFSDLFQLSVLKQYHRTISMEEFFELFNDRWPPGQREGQCISYETVRVHCWHKEGSPFGPFWDHFGVTFDSFQTYNVGHYLDSLTLDIWKARFPPSTTPVIALPGAPADFPARPEHRLLHQYLRWNKKVTKKVNNFIEHNLKRPFLGVHMRNGEDWARACSRIQGSVPSFMGSPQCERGRPGFVVTPEICFPPTNKVVDQVVKVLKDRKLASLFIATDAHAHLSEFRSAFAKEGMDVTIAQASDDPHFDLAVLGQSDYFIGNCVSTFTSFVTRERELSGAPVGFWCVE